MDAWRVEIPNWHAANLNTLMKCHWTKRRKLKQKDVDIVALYCKMYGVPQADRVVRRLRMTYIIARGSRAKWPDEDNVWKSAKDALKRAGMIHDDSPRWLVTEPLNYMVADQMGTIIELEDVK